MNERSTVRGNRRIEGELSEAIIRQREFQRKSGAEGSMTEAIKVRWSDSRGNQWPRWSDSRGNQGQKKPCQRQSRAEINGQRERRRQL